MAETLKAARYRPGLLAGRFAITQLEARAQGLPVIASKFYGKVVENGVNEVILEEPTGACIAAAVRDCRADADRLQKLAAASRVRDKFTIEALAHRLQQLGTTCTDSRCDDIAFDCYFWSL